MDKSELWQKLSDPIAYHTLNVDWLGRVCRRNLVIKKHIHINYRNKQVRQFKITQKSPRYGINCAFHKLFQNPPTPLFFLVGHSLFIYSRVVQAFPRNTVSLPSAQGSMLVFLARGSRDGHRASAGPGVIWLRTPNWGKQVMVETIWGLQISIWKSKRLYQRVRVHQSSQIKS